MAYTIQSGDTLSALAKRWGTSVDAIMAANPSITNANKIYAGRELTNPTESASSSAATSSSGSGVASNYNNPAGTAVLNNPNATLTDIINELKAATGTAADTYTKPEYTSITDPTIYSIADLEKLLGADYTYDRTEIENILKAATDAEYGIRYQEQGNAERGYYSNMATAQNTALDTIRQQQAQAIQQGVAQGMQNANMLSTILGTSQTANEEATLLAQDRQKLGLEYGAAIKQDSVDALTKANEAFTNAGTLSHQYYADAINQYAAQLEYNSAINTDYANYLASKYTADQGLLSQFASSGSGVYNNNQSSLATVEAAIQQAAAERAAAETSAQAQIKAAQINAAAYSSSGGGYSSGSSSRGSSSSSSSDGLTVVPTTNSTATVAQTAAAKASPYSATSLANVLNAKNALKATATPSTNASATGLIKTLQKAGYNL